ncbi:F-box protein SKIP22 [Melia azedarach]|uniref:F-box protein SKIP22 n=1 Tax=Melia azedarach TaxID=155640 RepID=A0ACC1XXN3_MELAZ|nr:F-box protein SKIP22 [Melia azedarach]
MKLRLRSLESRETQRLELPASGTVQQLKESLSQAISSSPSSLHFSLNGKDELPASSPQASLQYLGVTGGDLVYYSINPTAFVSENLMVVNENQGVNIQQPNSREISLDNGIVNANLGKEENPVQESEKIKVSGANSQEPILKCYEIPQEKQETLDFAGTEKMEIDEDLEQLPVKRKPEPYFLKRIQKAELADGIGPQGLVVLAVHAVLLESGFVGFDTESGMRIDRFDLADQLQLLSIGLSRSYTLPELLNDSSTDITEFVALKYQTIGHFVNVYGSLGKGDSGMHTVCLNAHKFGPIIDLMLANYDEKAMLNDKDENNNSLCGDGDEVFEFWKIVKDGLELPLLIDLCDKAHLSLPACMMRLPTELKLKILESLPGVDLAKMECVSKEMRFLATNNDLWKQKFAEEFGGKSDAQGNVNWKDRYALDWVYKRKRERAITTWYPRMRARPYVPIIREHIPFGDPAGDRNPYMPFAPFPFGQRRQGFARFNGRQSFAPNCNLGGV